MDTNNSLAQPQILVLTERNYDSCFMRMRTILHSQDLLEFVSIGYLQPVDQTLEMALTNAKQILLKENRKKDNKSLDLIQQGLNETIFLKVSSSVSSKQSWDTPGTRYQGVSKVKTLRRDF